MGRRGALLIQAIAAGIERLDTADPVVSSDPTISAVDLIYSAHREIDGTPRPEQIRESPESPDPLMSLRSRRLSRYH
jgi:hypothetical protein